MTVASEVFLGGIKWAILEKQSTTTKIEFEPFCVRGNPKMKSMDKSSQGAFGIGSGMYNPVFWACHFAIWHVQQHLTNFSTSYLRWGQKYQASTNEMVLSRPMWPHKPPACSSRMMCSLSDPRRIHRWSLKNKNSSCNWCLLATPLVHFCHSSWKSSSSAYKSFK